MKHAINPRGLRSLADQRPARRRLVDRRRGAPLLAVVLECVVWVLLLAAVLTFVSAVRR